ncbi:MAG: sigma-54-dependent Fis family transcriptional regulator [Candidatus Aminicenantes bacterium]|nr:sigma-54-dependent Fis family transcriptional regulator [Candidatus Aminicenantes bacterium]
MNSYPKKELIPLLVAEDDKLLSLSIKDFLESKGYKVYTAARCDKAINLLDHHTVNVALVDKKLPDGEGTSISEHIIKNNIRTKMILMTAYGSDERINEYIQKGAFDFLEKPIDLEKLLKRIENANRLYQLEYSQEALESYQKSAFKIIGNSPAILKIKKMIDLIAQSDSPVLIEGETGTGKELIARNIFLESNRSNKQFISVNCASIPENLFESEFFGYEKGAFTGAYKAKPGFFEMANYGALHLDEIGEMPVEFQAKLLRVLEEGSYIKLGGTKEIHVDTRIIASTNKNLKEEVNNKRFREDLYFRIAVFNIFLPPIRERKEDIPLIAEHLWNELIIKMGKKKLSPLFSFDSLKNYHWKGNVRELRNHLEKKLIYSSFGEKIQPAVNDISVSKTPKESIIPIETVVRDYVLEVFKRFDCNKTKTANALGMSLSTLKRKLKTWDIKVEKSLKS